MADSNFQDYASEFGELTLAVSRNIFSIPNLSANEKKHVIAETNEKISEAEATLSNMSLELDSMAKPLRAKLQGKYEECHESLATIKKDFAKAKFAMPKESTARDELMGGSGLELGERSLEQRSRIQDGLAQLNEDTQRIHDIARMAEETAGMGAGTLGELEAQRLTIERSRSSLRQTDSSLARAGRYIRTMQNRTIVTRLITACIILFLVVAIIVVIYVKWFKSSDSSSPAVVVAPSPPPRPSASPPPPARATTSAS